MAKVTFEKDGSANRIAIFVNDRKLNFDDETTVNISAGLHSMTWVVLGNSGNNYRVAITAPDDLAFEHKATLDDDSKDAGLHWFTVADGQGDA